MGLFKKVRNIFSGDKKEVDHMFTAENLEKIEDYDGAIKEYQKIIDSVYAGKNYSHYKHLTKKIVKCYMNLGDYDKVFELWAMQYDLQDYTGKEMYELIKLLEANQRLDLVMKVYEQAGSKLLRNKVEFLMKMKRIPEANDALNELLKIAPENSPEIISLWMMRTKLSMGLFRWEEANRYLDKILERKSNNEEARKLKRMCLKQVNGK